MKDVRLGYALHGFLGDIKLAEDGSELSTPDGNASYSWSILHEAQKRRWTTYLMQEDRDRHATRQVSIDEQFGSFSTRMRYDAYLKSIKTNGELLPQLDVLLIEWRWPIPGRNCQIDPKHPDYQPDLHRQMDIIKHYREKSPSTMIIFWDLDHKLTHGDERTWEPNAIFETSVSPRRQVYERTRVEPPFVMSELMQHSTLTCDPKRLMVYVGSRYERDDVIEEYMAPIASRCTQQIEFWGNWTSPANLAECQAKWPHFNYNGRVTMRDFRRVYGKAVSVPLLAKRSYIETGFITPRPWEALLFGSIPIGIQQMDEIDDYTIFSASDADEFYDVSKMLSEFPVNVRDQMRRENIENIEFMDASKFIDRIEEVVTMENVRQEIR